jgi:Na+-transporting methylmalonyl-CoA/oxaloacetate decarboxylase gamma subunit
MEMMVMVCFVRGLSRCARSAIAGKEVPTKSKEAKKMDFLSQLEANPICD